MSDVEYPKFGLLVRVSCQDICLTMAVMHPTVPFDLTSEIVRVRQHLSAKRNDGDLTKYEYRQLDALMELLGLEALPSTAVITLVNDRFEIVLEDYPDAAWFDIRRAIASARELATWSSDSHEAFLLDKFEQSLPAMAQAA